MAGSRFRQLNDHFHPSDGIIAFATTTSVQRKLSVRNLDERLGLSVPQREEVKPAVRTSSRVQLPWSRHLHDISVTSIFICWSTGSPLRAFLCLAATMLRCYTQVQCRSSSS